MRIKILILSILLAFGITSMAQEINCSVQVSARQIEGTDREAFRELQQALYEFINNQSWTNFSYKLEERIECTILLTLSERLSSDQYKGKLNLVLRRPVYKTNFNTTMFNYIDKDVVFTYSEGEPLIFSEGSFNSNLTSMIAYYVYVFLGIDADSYSKLGGTNYYQQAQNIVQNAQNTSEPGWKAFENMKNRYWLTENLLNSQYRPIRESIYEYHRKGLDMMYDNVESGRNNIAESLKLLQQANRAKPGSFLLRLYLDAKREEIIKVFGEGSPNTKSEVVTIMKEIDPANGSKYQTILRN
ncbi:MAG: DUF4835 domain-containing protein [Bacteroidetes bacterium 4572_77]|nr:MAG: DUF4835 domain-containing protein [Bacteroidetes bacterium 4572_77]